MENMNPVKIFPVEETLDWALTCDLPVDTVTLVCPIGRIEVSGGWVPISAEEPFLQSELVEILTTNIEASLTIITHRADIRDIFDGNAFKNVKLSDIKAVNVRNTGGQFGRGSCSLEVNVSMRDFFHTVDAFRRLGVNESNFE